MTTHAERAPFERAVVELRAVLSQRGQSSVPLWTLLYAAKEFAAGRDCLGYMGTDGGTRLLADLSAEGIEV